MLKSRLIAAIKAGSLEIPTIEYTTSSIEYIEGGSVHFRTGGADHYTCQRTLPDGRFLRVYFCAVGGSDINDRLEIRVTPSDKNPVGFETFEQGPDKTFRRFNGPDAWEHYLLHQERKASLKRYHSEKSATLVPQQGDLFGVPMSDTELERMEKKYISLIGQALRVLKGKQQNIDIS